MPLTTHPSSFRDPDGSIFTKHDVIYRNVYHSYQNNYDHLKNSGLYHELVTKHLLVPHEEITREAHEQTAGKPVYKTLKPEHIPVISYPYEWCFEQLKAAALITLEIQLAALEKNMSLKDATAFNVQFRGTRPVFIDTLSFEIYEENKPWQAYGQFCRHFLGPLLLWVYNKNEVAGLNLKYPDGIPLTVISYCLPFKTRLNFSIFSHIHYHAKLEKNFEQQSSVKLKTLSLSKTRLFGIISHLRNFIAQLELNKKLSPWVNYYNTFSYSPETFLEKKTLVSDFISRVKHERIIDIGCNEGEFTLLCAGQAKQVLSIDSDPFVIEHLYKKLSSAHIDNVLPLVADITNPAPGIGFLNEERSSFLGRGRSDLSLALALLHHVSIGNNIPFSGFAKQLSELAPSLIIEFVPKDDVQAQRLLVTRKDIFTEYNLEGFISAFGQYFRILQQTALSNSGRILFLMQRHA